MGFVASDVFSCSTQTYILSNTIGRIHQYPLKGGFFLQKLAFFGYRELGCKPLLAVSNVAVHQKGSAENQDNDKPKYEWVKIGSDNTEEQKQAILKLPPKMINRCKALMQQIICYSPEKGSVSLLLEAWVKSMKPERADWLAVLKELDRLNHLMYFEVSSLLLYVNTTYCEGKYNNSLLLVSTKQARHVFIFLLRGLGPNTIKRRALHIFGDVSSSPMLDAVPESFGNKSTIRFSRNKGCS